MIKMAEKFPKPELDTCIEVAGNITASAIQSGKLEADVENVKKYLSEIYAHVVRLRTGRQP